MWPVSRIMLDGSGTQGAAGGRVSISALPGRSDRCRANPRAIGEMEPGRHAGLVVPFDPGDGSLALGNRRRRSIRKTSRTIRRRISPSIIQGRQLYRCGGRPIQRRRPGGNCNGWLSAWSQRDRILAATASGRDATTRYLEQCSAARRSARHVERWDSPAPVAPRETVAVSAYTQANPPGAL